MSFIKEAEAWAKIVAYCARRPRTATRDSGRVRVDERLTRDTILSPPTPAELEANQRRTAAMAGTDLGTRWDGNLEPVGELVSRVKDAISRLPRSQQGDARAKAMMDIAEYGGTESSTLGRGPAESLSTAPHRSEQTFGTQDRLGGGCAPAAINRAHNRFWPALQGTPLDAAARARDNRFGGNGRVSPNDINEAQRKFWAKQG